jgi:hypothetical protein
MHFSKSAKEFGINYIFSIVYSVVVVVVFRVYGGAASVFKNLADFCSPKIREIWVC